MKFYLFTLPFLLTVSVKSVLGNFTERNVYLKRSSVFGSSSGGDSKSPTEMFVSTFTDTVKDSNVLTDVFEISQTTPTDFRRFMYDYVKASATNLGMDCPHSITDTAAKAVEDHFETLVPPVMVKVFANTAAKYLQSEGLLNPTNAALLAVSYADALNSINIQHSTYVTGEAATYNSLDIVIDQNEAINYPTQFLNALDLSGLRTHIINLKDGVPIIIPRNIDPPRLCNGTRLTVKR